MCSLLNKCISTVQSHEGWGWKHHTIQSPCISDRKGETGWNVARAGEVIYQKAQTQLSDPDFQWLHREPGCTTIWCLMPLAGISRDGGSWGSKVILVHGDTSVSFTVTGLGIKEHTGKFFRTSFSYPFFKATINAIPSWKAFSVSLGNLNTSFMELFEMQIVSYWIQGTPLLYFLTSISLIFL